MIAHSPNIIYIMFLTVNLNLISNMKIHTTIHTITHILLYHKSIKCMQSSQEIYWYKKIIISLITCTFKALCTTGNTAKIMCFTLQVCINSKEIESNLIFCDTHSLELPQVVGHILYTIWNSSLIFLRDISPCASVVQWLACLTTNPLAGVRSQTKAVSTQLTKLFILPNGLVDKWILKENLGKINCGKLNVTVALYPGIMD